MSDTPFIGLALIAKNEEKSLPTLLESIRGAFDEVVLVDTGSKDDTVKVFEAWADEELAAGRLLRVGAAPFKWADNFAAARAYADSLLNAEWRVWADCDDAIAGAHNLREMAQLAPPELTTFLATYDYAQDQFGNCVCTLKRERMVRRGHGRWEGRVHEAQVIEGGGATEIPADRVQWLHRKHLESFDSKRNLRILRKWIKDEPENARVLAYLGTEELARGRAKQALRYFNRYLKLKTGWDEERAQVHRKLAMALNDLGRHEDAIKVAWEALRLLPSWPDSYLTLAEAHYRLGEVAKAAEWAREVIRRGVPDTFLIINPLDYVVQPKVVLAGALAGMGDTDSAIAIAEEVFAILPGHPLLVGPYQKWTRARKLQSTAEAFVACAQTLIGHDEQLRALRVLEAVPHYVQDNPGVVALRSQLRERVMPLLEPESYSEHYKTGGSKPEDFIPDEILMDLGDALPRAHFLLRGLKEQAA